MNEKDLVNLLVAILIASITAYIAKRRGRSPMLWFFLGAFFGLLGMLALFLFPVVKDPATEEKGQIEVIPKQETVSPESPEDQVLADGWFYLDSEHQQYGPVTLSELKLLFEEKKIDSSSFVWREGMQEWKKVSELSQLVASLST